MQTLNEETIIDNEIFVKYISKEDVFTTINTDNEIIDYFLNIPPLEEMDNHTLMQNISNHQYQDANLMDLAQTDPFRFIIQQISNMYIITMDGIVLDQPI